MVGGVITPDTPDKGNWELAVGGSFEQDLFLMIFLAASVCVSLNSSPSVSPGVIPAQIQCRLNEETPINDTTVICDRRQGLLCNRNVDTSCNDYELRLLCPCVEEGKMVLTAEAIIEIQS